MNNYITPKGLAELKGYVYKSGGYTPLDNAMQPFWNWFVTLIPLWVAPNLLTLFALFWIISGAVLWAVHEGSYDTVMPRWTYAYVAFCVFAYQLFDAIDGKQARRTGASGPLGQLFDHGCDAVNTIFALYCVNHAMHFELNWGYFLLNLTGTASFYLVQWEEFHTHVCRTNVGGFFGVTELQYGMIFFILLQFASGDEASNWTMVDIFGKSAADFPQLAAISVSKLMTSTAGILGGLQITQSLVTALNAAGSSVIPSLIPILIYLCAFMGTFAVTEWAWLNPGYHLLLIFPSYSLINSQQIVCNFTKMEMDQIPGSFLWFLLFPLNRYIIALVPSLEQYSRGFRQDAVPVMLFESYIAFIIFAANLTWYLMWCSKTISQITTFLDIHCFTIKHKKIQSK